MNANIGDIVLKEPNETYRITKVIGLRPNNIFVVDMIEIGSKNLLKIEKEQFVRFGTDCNLHFNSDSGFTPYNESGE